MKHFLSRFLYVLSVLLLFTDLIAAEGLEEGKEFQYVRSDTLTTVTKKDKRKEKKEIRRTELKNSHSRAIFMATYVFTELETKVNFKIPGGVLTASVGLEDNLDLPRNSSFLTGSFIYRFTPSSGLYVNYYGFNRTKTHVTDRDYYWGGDTIPAGSATSIFFKTQVISAGYLLSILKEPKSFLGAYFNVYVMPLKMGLKSDINKLNVAYEVIAPLPNFGILAMFSLTKWLTIYGNIGFFSLYVDALGGSINDFNIALLFKATKWLNFNVSIQNFYVHVVFPDQAIDTSVDYNYVGPAIGIALTF